MKAISNVKKSELLSRLTLEEKTPRYSMALQFLRDLVILAIKLANPRKSTLAALQELSIRFDGRVVVHLFFLKDAIDFVRGFSKIPSSVSFTSSNEDVCLYLISNGVPKANVVRVLNVGRNVAPIFTKRLSERFDETKFVFVHIKHTPQIGEYLANVWNLLVLFQMNLFFGRNRQARLDEQDWVCFPSLFLLFRRRSLGWAGTEMYLEDPRFTNLRDAGTFLFPESGMFACGREYLLKLEKLGVRLTDFEPEPLDKHGNFSHFLERVLGASASGSSPVIALIGGRGFLFHFHKPRY
jgi:hypothetical protein